MDDRELDAEVNRATKKLGDFQQVALRCKGYFNGDSSKLPHLGRSETLALAHYIASNPLVPISNREVEAIQERDPEELAFILMTLFFDWGYMQAVDDLHQEKLVV